MDKKAKAMLVRVMSVAASLDGESVLRQNANSAKPFMLADLAV
ncbi:hypothetical protein [Celerinatantimonas sp. YJH-8]